MKANQSVFNFPLSWVTGIYVLSLLLAIHQSTKYSDDSLLATEAYQHVLVASPSNSGATSVHLPVILDTHRSVPTNGLLLHYRFEGNSLDSSGFSNHGTNFGGISYTSGKVGLAARFDGINDYVRSISPPILGHLGSTFTIGFWLKPENYQNGGVIDIGKENRETWEISHRNQLTSYVQNWNRPQREIFPYTLPTPLNVWTYVTFVFDDNLFIAFVNGIEAANYSFNYGPIIDGDEWIEVGVNAPGGDEYFKGQVDEVRIYGRALQDFEIQELFNEGN